MRKSSIAGAPARWRRRKVAQPAEIIAAALEVFGAHGFAAARLKGGAYRAGVSKGSIYLSFASKEALFRAVVQGAISPNVEAVRAAAFEGPLSELTPSLLAGAAGLMALPGVAGLARMVISQSGNFPDLARAAHPLDLTRLAEQYGRTGMHGLLHHPPP